MSLCQWVFEWVSAQVSKFKARFRCHASAMQNLFAIRCDYGPTLCKIQHLPKRPWCIFCKGQLLLSWLPCNNATLLKYISIIYEFCLAWQGYDIWITFEPKSCSTAELVELNSLELSLKVWFRFRASAVLLYNLIPVFSLVWQKHDVWAGPQLVSPLNQCFYCHLTGTITLQALLLHPCKESECAFSPFMIW